MTAASRRSPATNRPTSFAPILCSHDATCAALWLGSDLAIFFHRGFPIGFVYAHRLMIARDLPTGSIRFLSRWLMDNKLPLYIEGVQTRSFNERLLSAIQLNQTLGDKHHAV